MLNWQRLKLSPVIPQMAPRSDPHSPVALQRPSINGYDGDLPSKVGSDRNLSHLFIPGARVPRPGLSFCLDCDGDGAHPDLMPLCQEV